MIPVESPKTEESFSHEEKIKLDGYSFRMRNQGSTFFAFCVEKPSLSASGENAEDVLLAVKHSLLKTLKEI